MNIPFNNGDNNFDDEVDIYSSEHFRIYEFKIRKCSRSRSHDWTDCPFAHPGEKARRRDPRMYNYSGHVCPDYRRGGSCRRGDDCEFSHGVFESWLHPSCYRTEVCNDGIKCLRKICFFAHTPRQLRILPIDEIFSRKRNLHNCCATTLAGKNPPPILVPANLIQKMMNLDQSTALSEFNRLFDAMNLHKARNNEKSMNLNANDCGKKCVISDQPKLRGAPGTPSTFRTSIYASSTSRSSNFVEDKYDNDNGFVGPDLGWVNDLLT